MKLMILTVLSAFYYHYYGLEETVIVLIIGLTLFIVFGGTAERWEIAFPFGAYCPVILCNGTTYGTGQRLNLFLHYIRVRNDGRRRMSQYLHYGTK